MQRLFLSHDGDPVSAITPEEMLELLRYTVRHGAIGPEELVESAARSAYSVIWPMIWKAGPDKPVFVVAGDSYTGAAALALARHMANHDVSVDVLHVPGAKNGSADRQLQACRLSSCMELDDVPGQLSGYSLVIDALSDIIPGSMNELAGTTVEALQHGGAGPDTDSTSRAFKVVAFEAPAGVDAGTGVAGEHSLQADTSIAFGLPKTGMGVPAFGSITVADIGIPRNVYRRQATIAHPCNFRDGFVIPLRAMNEVGY